MRSSRLFHAVDTHTEGMPTRVIIGGVGVLPGRTMNDKRLYFIEHLDHIRKLLVNEPRGHASMSCAILQPSTRSDCDWGVVGYLDASGNIPMCGHGTIGVATVLVETGMVEVSEPVTTINLDTPAGLVIARVQVKDGRASAVTVANVPSYVERLDHVIEVPGVGVVPYSIAFGGNFFALVRLDDIAMPYDRRCQAELLQIGLKIMAAVNEQCPPRHPTIAGIDHCHHVEFIAPGSTASHSRHAMAIYPGWYDRSPCGTGTSARMAELWVRGDLALGADFVNESFIGSRFIGRITSVTEVAGIPAVTPEITGRAWITGTATYMLDPHDPYQEGFEF